MDVSTAVKKRISTRAFLPTELPRDQVEAWLKDAQRAPSGGNLQPRRVIALAGDDKLAVENLAAEKLLSNPRGEPSDYPIYPQDAPAFLHAGMLGHLAPDSEGASQAG